VSADDDIGEEEDQPDEEREIDEEEQQKLIKQYDQSQGKKKWNEFLIKDEDEMAKKYEEINDFDELSVDEVDQQSRQPSAKDPKLWLVKCKIGTEKECVNKIYHKYFYYLKKRR